MKQTAIWLLRLLPALILLQTLYFKFTAHPESVYIFSRLGIEPWGRIGSGIAEAIAAVLLLWPRFTHWGALLATGLMGGAIMSHLTRLGIVVINADGRGDGGQLFMYASIVFLCSAALLYIFRKRFSAYRRIFPRTAIPV